MIFFWTSAPARLPAQISCHLSFGMSPCHRTLKSNMLN
jgi:hypothetical protein